MLWIEYAHNSLVLAASGVSPFIPSLGYQPPLFDHQGEEVIVLSVQVNLCRCKRVWRHLRAALLRSSSQVQRQANRRRAPAPAYQPGQRVWLYSKDLPLQTESQKLASHFFMFEVDRMINMAAICQKLPASLNIHSTLHISRVKPVRESELKWLSCIGYFVCVM